MAHALTAPDRGTDSPAGIETGLLDLKGRRARSRPEHVPRERLVRQLSEARHAAVALIFAPAGYGKTTLVSEWAARDERPFAWVTLDEADNEPTTLLSAIALALDAVEPIGWEAFEALSSKRPDAATIALQRLAQALSCREEPCVLALDDVHVLEAPAARRSLLALGQALLPGSQLALAGRSNSALPVGRMRAQGSSLELGAEQLAMTSSEAAALMRQAGIELSAEQVLSLVRRTEGWPAGLHLAALSLAAQKGDRLDTAEFAGGDRLVSEYVREEFLSGLSSEDIEFMTRTSVLEHLSASLCDALLERNGSADVLTRLARSNVMLVSLDPCETSYRYHGMFAEVLRSELRRREPGQEAQLHRRASDCCEEHGDLDGAIDHAIDAHDVERVGRLLWAIALRRAGSGDDAAISGRLSNFADEELGSTPLLALAAAGSSLSAGDLDEAARWTSLADRGPKDGNLVDAGVAIMQAAIGRQGVARMGSDASRALGLLADDDPWRPLCLLFDGVARHLGGDRIGAQDQLQEAAYRAAVSAPMFQALCLAQLAVLALETGDLERAGVLGFRAGAQVERCGLGEQPMVALVFAALAAVRAEQGREEQARADLRQAMDLLAEIVDPSPWYEVECRILLARTTLRLNGLTAARELLALAAKPLLRMPDPGVLTEWLERAQAEIDFALDSTADADWSLTAAELRVLRFMPSHLSLREIAERLFVSPNTVKTHARGIYRKLEVSSRGHAVDRARDAGLLTLIEGKVCTDDRR